MWNEKAGGAEFDNEFEAFMNDMGGGAPKVMLLPLILINNLEHAEAKSGGRQALCASHGGSCKQAFWRGELKTKGEASIQNAYK